VRGTCPARNSRDEPCRFPGVWSDGRCPYHTRTGRILPGEPVHKRGKRKVHPSRLPPADPPIYDPDRLPSLARAVTLNKLRAWAAEFDSLDQQRYSALEFIDWLELELAPPVTPKEDEGPVYTLVGAAAAAFG